MRRSLRAMVRRGCGIGVLLGVWVGVCAPAAGKEWYVAKDGKAEGKGTAESPWDVTSTLRGEQTKVEAGDTVYLMGGIYKVDRSVKEVALSVKLAGKAGRPITIRPAAGAHVVIDGRLQVYEPAEYLVIRDLEILVSEPRPTEALERDPTYANIKQVRPWGGIDVWADRGCKYVNLVIHDCLQGMGFWQQAVDSEVYGCIIYDNGWAAKDRGHGHAIYTQNGKGTKTISNCIFSGGYGYTLHAYESGEGNVENFRISDNITYGTQTGFLVGGERPSKGNRIMDNFFHDASVKIGYGKGNVDVEFVRNILCGGGVSFNEYQRVDFEGNRLLGAGVKKNGVKEMKETDNQAVAAGDLGKERPVIFLRPNKYDGKRAHLAIYNPAGKDTGKGTGEAMMVEVDTGGMIKEGQKYRLMDPRDMWGKAVVSETARGKAIRVPVKGDLAVYVLLVD